MVIMRQGVKAKTWVSIATVFFLVVVVFFSWSEIEKAYDLLDSVNFWILFAIVPLQFLSYYAAGETIFSYLKKQKHIKRVSAMMCTRLALEMNFVNHVLPSGGVSGISYMGWRLKHFGVSASRSTTAQLVRMVATFAAFSVVLFAAILLMIIDGGINRWIVAATVGLVTVMGSSMLVVFYILDHERRFAWLARKITLSVNAIVRRATFGRKANLLEAAKVREFFVEIEKDYRVIRANIRLLVQPFLWGLVFIVSEVAMFYVTFLALGHVINPAPLVIAFGLAGVAGFFVVTPGGAGAYEVIMLAFLTAAGLNPGIALLGILLTRVLLLVGTIVTGYVFYQQAVLRHGKAPDAITKV